MPEPEDNSGPNGGSAGSALGVASYIGALSAELALLALANGFGPLGYILEIARLEANAIARADESKAG